MRTAKEALSDILDTWIGDEEEIRATTLHNVNLQKLLEGITEWGKDIVDACASNAVDGVADAVYSIKNGIE